MQELQNLRRQLAIRDQRIEALKADLTRAQAVVKLADELCTAIESAEHDIGGSRSMRDIIGDLGPAVEEALGR
jgi:hypothetical protein